MEKKERGKLNSEWWDAKMETMEESEIDENDLAWAADPILTFLCGSTTKFRNRLIGKHVI